MQRPAILTLVRHGQTRANIEKVWHGSIDTPLTELGLEQAQRVAAHLAALYRDATAVYTSPLQRTRLTAERIAAALGLPHSLLPELAEFHLGEWEGKPYSELHRVHRMWNRMQEDPDYAPPGAESARQVAVRVASALRKIAAAHPGERVIAVSHGGALTLGLGLLLDGVPNAWTRVMENCSVSELVLEPAPELLSFNRTGHL